MVGGRQIVEALRRLETEAVVADHKRKAMGLEDQEQVGRARLCMPGHIVKGFLGNAVDGNLALRIQPDRRALDFEMDLQAGGLLNVVGQHLERGGQSQVLQVDRTERPDNPPHALQESDRPLAKFGQPVGRVRRTPLDRHLSQLGALVKNDQGLDGIVVKLARQPAAFILLAARQGADVASNGILVTPHLLGHPDQRLLQGFDFADPAHRPLDGLEVPLAKGSGARLEGLQGLNHLA